MLNETWQQCGESQRYRKVGHGAGDTPAPFTITDAKVSKPDCNVYFYNPWDFVLVLFGV